MDVDTKFAPPDASGEVTLPVAPSNPDRPNQKARAAMVVTVAVVAFAGLFFVGRWTTSGERSVLVNERDAAEVERDRLQASLDRAQKQLADASAVNATSQSTIDALESDATRTASQLADLQAKVTQLTGDNDVLQTTNSAQWVAIDDVSVCADAVTAADTTVEKWSDVWSFFERFASGEVSPDDADIERQLGRAFLALNGATTELTIASARCSTAIDGLPQCGDGATALRLATELRDSPCPATE